jgi:hypothetical protein
MQERVENEDKKFDLMENHILTKEQVDILIYEKFERNGVLDRLMLLREMAGKSYR